MGRRGGVSGGGAARSSSSSSSRPHEAAVCAGRQQPAALLTHCSAHRLGGALPLAAAGGLLAFGVGDLGGLPLAVLLVVPVLGLGGLCRSSSVTGIRIRLCAARQRVHFLHGVIDAAHSHPPHHTTHPSHRTRVHNLVRLIVQPALRLDGIGVGNAPAGGQWEWQVSAGIRERARLDGGRSRHAHSHPPSHPAAQPNRHLARFLAHMGASSSQSSGLTAVGSGCFSSSTQSEGLESVGSSIISGGLKAGSKSSKMLPAFFSTPSISTA